MKIEALLTEAEISQEFADALEARDLPEKFFYWTPMSVSAWLALAHDGLIESQKQSWKLLVGDVEKVASEFDSEVAVVSLGSGDGAKDILLAKALAAAKLGVEYFPVDASQTLIEIACAEGEDAEIDTLGIKADISSPMHLVLAGDASEHPKLFLSIGNTLGAFDPLDQIKHLAQSMHPADRLIVDGEIYGETTLSARDNPAWRRFAAGPMASVGVWREDGEVRFEMKRDERHSGLNPILRYLHAGRDIRIKLPGKEVVLQRGERVNLNFNYTYSPEAFRWLLTKHGDLKILHEFPSVDGKYLTALCAR